MLTGHCIGHALYLALPAPNTGPHSLIGPIWQVKETEVGVTSRLMAELGVEPRPF